MMMRHTLRSEHIPWNVFFPMSLSDDMKSHAVDVFNAIIGQVSAELPKIKYISSIKIEFAPKDEHATEAPFTMCYLNDRTSFDTYIEYVAEDGEKGGIGIEVKYTEEGYHPGEAEKKAAITHYKNPKHRYLDVMKKSAYYIPAAFMPDDKHPNLWSPLVSNELRQIWRNHLLGASMVQHRTSVISCPCIYTLKEMFIFMATINIRERWNITGIGLGQKARSHGRQ